MSLYDDALAAGRQEELQRLRETDGYAYSRQLFGDNNRLDPDILNRLLAGEAVEGYSIGTDNTAGGTWNGTDQYVPGPDRTIITGPQSGGTWGTQQNDAWDEYGGYLGESSGDSTAMQTAKFIAMSVGGYYGVQGINGMETSLANAGGSSLDAAMMDMGAGATNVAGGAGASAAETAAAQAAAEAAAAQAAAQQAGVQTIEIVGSKLPAVVGPTTAEVAATVAAPLTMEQLGNIETLPEEVADPTNYSNEGRNYPTTESTQGSGGSPVNSTSQFPGTPITDVNGNPVVQPTYDANGNPIIPPVNGTNGTPGTQLPGNQLPGGTSPLGTNDFKNLFDVLSGLYGLKLANEAQEKSDPFGPYRKGYADKLLALEANPGLIKNTPGFFAGQDMINRSMASKGYLGSGNQAAALQRYGGDFYNQEANRLSTLAGANINPGNTYFNSANLANQSLQGIGYGLAPYFPGGPR